MAEIDIYVESSLLEEVRRLAVEQYGDDSEASQRRLVETALEMRLLWSNSVAKGQEETGEAASRWQFPDTPATIEDKDRIRAWLFKRDNHD